MPRNTWRSDSGRFGYCFENIPFQVIDGLVSSTQVTAFSICSTRFLYYLSVYWNLSKNSFFYMPRWWRRRCFTWAVWSGISQKRMQRYGLFTKLPNVFKEKCRNYADFGGGFDKCQLYTFVLHYYILRAGAGKSKAKSKKKHPDKRVERRGTKKVKRRGTKL